MISPIVMKKSEHKEVLILGDKKRVIKRIERREKETISALERFKKGGKYFNSKQV